MATIYQPMPPARIDRTAETALQRVSVREEPVRLHAPLIEWVEAQRVKGPLMEMFVEMARSLVG
jgi:hypothetical protein